MRIFVLGAGATGSLLTQLLERQGHTVWCGDRDPERARRFLGKKSTIAVTEVNARNLRGIVRAAMSCQLVVNASASTTNWQLFAALTIPRRFRAFTSVTAIVLFLPRKRRARSGSRSPHQTVCPCRSSNCARREPVAPAPRTKIRMAWPKLYHRPRAGILDLSGFGSAEFQ